MKSTISGYDPSLKPKSVDTIDEELRALHLDMGRSKTKAVGKTLSRRKIISFQDEKGRTVNGIFTPPAEELSGKDQQNQLPPPEGAVFDMD